MNGFKWMAVLLCVSLAFSGCARQEEENPWWTSGEPNTASSPDSSAGEPPGTSAPAFKGPVLMTSFGQSADVLMLQKIFDVLSVPVTVDTLAPPEAIGSYATVIVVVGGSSKGLAAAALTEETEQERAAAFAEALEAADVSVMVAHIGGDLRRIRSRWH